MKRPDFAKGGGLVPAIAQEACSGEVLMLAYMNEEAYDKTLATGEVHYYSRSRQEIWHKGATSGHVQKVVAVRIDLRRRHRPRAGGAGRRRRLP